MSNLLTIDEVADRLKTRTATIYSWVSRGKIGAVRIGTRCLRVPEDELLAFIKKGEQPAGQP